MKRTINIGFVLGLALTTGLVVHAGVGEVTAAVAVVGWGILVISLFRLPLIAFDALSWRAVIRHADRPGWWRLLWYRYVADSVNTLLPVARVGGEVVRAHLLTRTGVAGPRAGAGVIVDMTVGAVTQLPFTLAGIGFFMVLAGGGGGMAWRLAAGLLLFTAGIAVFLKLQMSGTFLRLARFFERAGGGRVWLALTGDAGALDAAIAAAYRHRQGIFWCAVWRILGWVVGAAEVWLILYFLGHPVTLAEAFVLESLGQAARSAGFMIPGGLGVQEGGFLLVGSQLGLTPDLALALSLIKRVRELLIGVPCLLVWQVGEGWSAFRRKAEVQREEVT